MKLPSQGPLSVGRKVSRESILRKAGLFFVENFAWEVGTELEGVIQLPVKPNTRRPAEIRFRGRITHLVPQKQGGAALHERTEHLLFIRPILQEKKAAKQ